MDLSRRPPCLFPSKPHAALADPLTPVVRGIFGDSCCVGAPRREAVTASVLEQAKIQLIPSTHPQTPRCLTGAVFPRGLARRQGDLPRQPRLPLPVLERARTLRGERMLLLGKAGLVSCIPVSLYRGERKETDAFVKMS